MSNLLARMKAVVTAVSSAKSLPNDVKQIEARCVELADEYSQKGLEILNKIKDELCKDNPQTKKQKLDTPAPRLDDRGDYKTGIIEQRRECYIREYLQYGKQLLPKVLELENEIIKFHDKFNRNERKDLVASAVYYIEYQIFNIFAFVKMMKDVCENETHDYYEQIIFSTNEANKKRFYFGVLANYIGSVKSNIPSNSMSLLCNYAREDVDSTKDKEKYLDFCDEFFYRIKQNFLNSKFVGSLASNIEEMPGNIRELVVNLYKDAIVAMIASDIISSHAMQLFLAADPSQRMTVMKTLTWSAALENEELRNEVLKAIREKSGGLFDESEIMQKVRESPGNALLFDNFRRMLTKDHFFGPTLQAPDDNTIFPMDKVSLCAIGTHGGCSFSFSENVQTSKIPEGLTLYYVTNVSHEFNFSLGNPVSTYEMLRGLASLHSHPRMSNNHTSGTDISEKELVEFIIPYVKKKLSYDKATYIVGKDSVVDYDRLNATHIPFFNNGSFVVKKYSSEDPFPFRRWVAGNKDDFLEVFGMSRFIMFSPSIAAKAGQEELKQYDSNLLFKRVENLKTKALVLIDLSCKNIDFIPPGDRLAQDIRQARFTKDMYASGKVIAFFGGRRQPPPQRSRRRTKKRALRTKTGKRKGGRDWSFDRSISRRQPAASRVSAKGNGK